MKEIAKIKAKEERKKLESEVRLKELTSLVHRNYLGHFLFYFYD